MVEDNLILKKTIGHNQIQFNDGEFTIWNIPSVIMTMNTYALLEEVGRNKFGNDFRDLIYYLGKKQAYAGTKILQKQYGFTEMKKAVQMELQTSAMIGLGKLNLSYYNFDEKKVIVKIFPNPFASMHKKLFGISKEPVDHFIRGGCAGIFSYAFGVDLIGIETQCLAMGKPSCILEFRELDKWDLSNPIIAKQIPKSESEYRKIIDNLTALSMKKV